MVKITFEARMFDEDVNNFSTDETSKSQNSFQTSIKARIKLSTNFNLCINSWKRLMTFILVAVVASAVYVKLCIFPSTWLQREFLRCWNCHLIENYHRRWSLHMIIYGVNVGVDYKDCNYFINDRQFVAIKSSLIGISWACVIRSETLSRINLALLILLSAVTRRLIDFLLCLSRNQKINSLSHVLWAEKPIIHVHVRFNRLQFSSDAFFLLNGSLSSRATENQLQNWFTKRHKDVKTVGAFSLMDVNNDSGLGRETLDEKLKNSKNFWHFEKISIDVTHKRKIAFNEKLKKKRNCRVMKVT